MAPLAVLLGNLGWRRVVLRALREAERCCETRGALRGLTPRQCTRVTAALARAEARAAWPVPTPVVRHANGPARGIAGSAARTELETCLAEAADAVDHLAPDPVALGVAVELLEVVAALGGFDRDPSRSQDDVRLKILHGVPARG